MDLTCLSITPRIDTTGDNNHYIGGYLGNPDRDATISFERRVDTGQGNDLPPGTRQNNSPSLAITRLYMPSLGGNKRIGVFYCQAEKLSSGVTEMTRVTTITMAKNSKNISNCSEMD